MGLGSYIGKMEKMTCKDTLMAKLYINRTRKHLGEPVKSVE